jgi:hypothetical protein
VPWSPIPATYSRGRDSNRQSLKRCRWTGRVFNFLRSPGETLNSRAVSSPLFTNQRDCEMSGNIYVIEREGSVTNSTSMSFLLVLSSLPAISSRSALLFKTHPCRLFLSEPSDYTFHWVVPTFTCSGKCLRSNQESDNVTELHPRIWTEDDCKSSARAYEGTGRA